MFLRDFVLGTLLVSAVVYSAESASAASPSLGGIEPRGIQRGVESVLSFNGARMADAEEILFYEPAGFEVKKLEPVDASVKATVNVSPTCRLGQHVAQVRTKSGVSEYRTFYVGPFAAIDEKEPNSEFVAPQPIPLNTTVIGVVQNEDVDYFLVEAKQGQRISAEIEGIRLGTAMFDPYIAILNSKRFELSAEDDSPLVWQDAVVSAVAPEDGQYVIEVRESAYGGNGNCRYRLHVGTFPRPTAVYPAGGKFGEAVDVTFLGDPTGPIAQKVTLPSAAINDFALHATTPDGISPTGNVFRLVADGNVLELEPNNAVAEATPAQLPVAFNGIIQEKGDTDFFKFQAKAGQVFDIECYSRRIRSGLDPVLVVYNASGGGLASNDDARGQDSFFRWSVPADGEYLISVRDHLGAGAPDFVYRVELTPPKPALSVSIPRVARYSQYRQWIVVPRGNRFGTLLTASRAEFGGDLLLEPKDMPAGITIHAQPMPANTNIMPVVFEAAADAPIAGKLVDFTTRHADPAQNISGGYQNVGDFIISSPGQSLYWTVNVDRIPVCVVDEVPFKLEIVQPKVPLVRDGSMQLKIVAQRKEGYKTAINVQVPFLPPGVGGASSVAIPEGQTEVLYPLNANGAAAIQKWKIYAIGSADAGGEVWVASQMADLEITEPFVQFALQRAATEQGKPTEIVCNVTQVRPFEGKAKVQLLGLPAKVTTLELELTKEMKELVFPVTTAADANPGTHKNIFCQVTITENAEPILHARLGGTEFRIDVPIPPKANEPPKPAAAPQPVAQAPTPQAQPPEPVRLTRLQKLRLEAQQKQSAETGGGTK